MLMAASTLRCEVVLGKISLAAIDQRRRPERDRGTHVVGFPFGEDDRADESRPRSG